MEGDGGSDKLPFPPQKPELKDGVRPWKPKKQNNLLGASLPVSKYFLIKSKKEADNWALSLSPNIANIRSPVLYGLDTENNTYHTSEITRVLKICFPSSIETQTVGLHLSAMFLFETSNFSKSLK